MHHALALMAFGCAARTLAGDDAQQATTWFDHGQIYLGAPEWRAVEALVVRNGRVVFAGRSDEAQRAAGGGSVTRIDLGGAIALPGLQDAHGHVEKYGRSLEIVDLRGARSVEELVTRVLARAASAPAGEWITGRGWDQNLFADRRFPEHALLSNATGERPVYLERVDGHAAFVNRRALELAGLDGDLRGHEHLPGGEILLDSSGRATGVLIDTAKELVSSKIPEPTDEQRKTQIRLADERLVAFGLTAVHDMGIARSDVALFASVHAATHAHPREIAYLWGNDGLGEAQLAGLPIRDDSADRVQVVGVKLMVDGALGSRGAALLADYADAPGERGHLIVERARLQELVDLAAARGLQPAIHAIGDFGNRTVLDCFASAEGRFGGLKSLRPRVEHAQIVAPEDWSRFASLGAIASMQPTHATSDMPWAESRLGPARLAGAYAWKRLATPTTPLAFGSDFPVESPDPLAGIYAAITRQDASGSPDGGWLPDQKLSVREALTAFTLGAAFAVHEEDRRGKLELGYFADLTVLDVDPLVCAPKALLNAHIRMTVIDGAVVFDGRAH